MTNANTDEHELEQIMARYMEDLEAGRCVDEAALKSQYAHLEPDLSEFLQAHRKFVQAAQAARDEIEAASSDTHSSRELDTDAERNSSTGVSSTQSVPRQLGPYEIIEEIDRGGMGVVYRAKHVSLDRIVALKLIRSGELASDEEVQRFHTEAAAAAALNHPALHGTE